MIEWLRFFGVNYVIAATKFDKLKRSEYQGKINVIKNKLKLVDGDILVPFSAEKGTGVDELWDGIGKFIFP
jgi:GTP-binding protein